MAHDSGRSGTLTLALAGAACALAGYTLWERLSWPRAPRGEPRAIEPRGSLAEFEKAAVDIFAAVSPAVVHITSPEVVTGYDPYGGAYGLPAGTGTGFVWNADGYIVTNWHVVRERNAVLVRFANGREHEARVVGKRPEHDIAVVQLVSLPPALQPIPKIGQSSDLRVGQAVFAIGNPFGFDQSLTTGIISALNRKIVTQERSEIEGCVQVDAAINPGNSGGPLLDSAGRLIGMNTAIHSPTGASAGIGFAVPVDTINEVVPTLVDPKKRKPVLGVVLGETEEGVEIRAVARGSGAEEAGLLGPRRRSRGDIIIGIDGQPVRRNTDIEPILSKRKVGDEVVVSVIRGYPYAEERVDVRVTLR